MRLKLLIGFLSVLFFASCSSSRRVVTPQKKKEVVEPKPETKLPSVKQIQHVKKLEKGDKSLNRYTLQYIRKFAPLAVLEMHEYKIPASITLAQGILESGNGRSELASKSNNHFGIKCHTEWKGERVYHDDDEKGECFRKYKYVQSSYEDHSKFLTSRRRYANLFKLRRTDYRAWAKGLKKAGYATDKKYPSKLIRIIETYQLYEFDKFSEKDLKRGKRVKEEEEIVIAEKKETTEAKSYLVRKGDTLYSIAKKFGTTVPRLKKINNIKGTTLSIGQEIRIE